MDRYVFIYNWGYRYDVYIGGRTYTDVSEASIKRLKHYLEPPFGFGHSVTWYHNPFRRKALSPPLEETF